MKRTLSALRYATCSFPVRNTLKVRVIRTEGAQWENQGHVPVIREDDLLGGMNETGLGIGGRVEDFAGILIGRGHNDETTWGIASTDTVGQEFKLGDGHVKYANSAQVAGIPLAHVTLHGGLERIREFTNYRDSPSRSGQMAFFVSVDGLFECKEGEQDGKGRVQP